MFNRQKTIILILALLFVLQVGCGNKSSNKASSGSIQGDPLTVISTAVKDLNYSTNFEAVNTLVTKINGSEVSTKISEFTVNSSNTYAVSSIELRANNKKVLFKRRRIKNVLYEYDPGKNRWDIITRDKEPALFTYNAYKSNRALVLNLISQIYSEKDNKFAEFLKNIKEEGTKTTNGYNATVYSYSSNMEDSKRIVKQNGEIFVAKVNNKLYIVKVLDDKFITLKSNKNTVENITDIEIKNIEKARELTQKE